MAQIETNALDNSVAFVNKLRELVRNESAESQRSIESIWRRPLPERVAQGFALNVGSPQFFVDKGIINLQVKHNLSRFREGDPLFLGRGNPLNRFGLPVTLESEYEERLILSLRNKKANDDILLLLESMADSRSDWSLEVDFEDMSHFYLAALEDVLQTTIGRESVLPLLTGRLEASTDTIRYERAAQRAEELHLDCAQSEAFALAYAADPAWLVQGPPGTGKTYLLAEIVRLLVQDGERVLVTSFTHKAINNALARIRKADPEIAMAKIGVRSQSPQGDLLADNYEYFGLSPLASQEKGYVVGATPFALRTDRLNQVLFDTIIFDEASQITLPLAIMAMLSGRKFLFFGDHRQLPPVFVSAEDRSGFYRSIFSLFTDRGMESMLTTTHRLNASLAEWPSRTFYNGRLKSSAEAASRQVSCLTHAERWSEILDPGKEKVFVSIPGTGSTTRNELEAKWVVALIEEMLCLGLSAEEVGVVVPYRAQARLIKQKLQYLSRCSGGLSEQGSCDIVADTVERLQGQEREVVILSLTTSRPSFARRIGSFFYQLERLNVSITRARSKLIVLGCDDIIKPRMEKTELEQRIALFAEFLGTAKRIVVKGAP